METNSSQIDGKAPISERQLAAMKQVNDACLKYLDLYAHSSGFLTDYYGTTVTVGGNALRDFLDGAKEENMRQYGRVRRVFLQNWFDLHGTEVYNELGDYIRDKLSVCTTWAEDELGKRRPDSGEIDKIVRAKAEKATEQFCEIVMKYLPEVDAS